MRVAILILALLSVFFYNTTNEGLGDFRYLSLVSHQLWHEGNLQLNRHRDALANDVAARADGERSLLGSSGDAPLPYQIGRVGDHLYHVFPPGSALLLAPVQGLLETVGLPVLDGQGHYNARREAKFQHYVASIAMAALVALCFLHARRFLV